MATGRRVHALAPGAFLVMAVIWGSAEVTPATAATHEITLPAETATLKKSSLSGYAIAQQKCGICHSADYINLQPPLMTLAQWTAEMVKMQHSYGAPIDETEIKLLGIYLASAYGDAATVTAADAAPTLPTQDAGQTGRLAAGQGSPRPQLPGRTSMYAVCSTIMRALAVMHYSKKWWVRHTMTSRRNIKATRRLKPRSRPLYPPAAPANGAPSPCPHFRISARKNFKHWRISY